MHYLMAQFGVTLILSYFGVRGLISLAERHQILDIPNERSSHTRVVPRGGGLSIVVLTLAGVWLIYAWMESRASGLSLIAYTLGAVLIAAVSWLDDLRSRPTWIRFTMHICGALLAIWAFGFWQEINIAIFGHIHLGWLGLLATLMWIVGLTNAYNFMDGIDGIAGGQAVVAGVWWAAIGWLNGQPMVCGLGLLLASTSLGFLFHNWPPARIFMGDVGSAFLGYNLAVLPLIYGSQRETGSQSVNSALAYVLPVWPFVFDAVFTFLRRLRRGENVFAAHRSHLYQRLVIFGYTHRFVTLLYNGLALTGMSLALVWAFKVPGGTIAGAILLPLLCFGLWAFVVRQEHRQAAQNHSRLPTLPDHSEIR